MLHKLFAGLTMIFESNRKRLQLLNNMEAIARKDIQSVDSHSDVRKYSVENMFGIRAVEHNFACPERTKWIIQFSAFGMNRQCFLIFFYSTCCTNIQKKKIMLRAMLPHFVSTLDTNFYNYFVIQFVSLFLLKRKLLLYTVLPHFVARLFRKFLNIFFYTCCSNFLKLKRNNVVYNVATFSCIFRYKVWQFFFYLTCCIIFISTETNVIYSITTFRCNLTYKIFIYIFFLL